MHKKKFANWKDYKNKDSFSSDFTQKKKYVKPIYKKNSSYQQKTRERQEQRNKAISLQLKRVRAENSILTKLYQNQINPNHVENYRDGIQVDAGHTRLSARV